METVHLSHSRMGYINPRSLKTVSKVDYNGFNCDGDGTAGDV